MGKLTGKVTIVTGASRGIGQAIARALVGEGAAVLLTARGAEALEATTRQLVESGGTAICMAGDIASEAFVGAVFARAADQFQRLDLLVNNAGAFDGGPLESLPVETWDRVVATNLRAPFLCTQAAMRVMKPQRGGRIINVGSISAHRVRPNSAAYSASKHGLWGLSQVTALEGREFGITCCCLQPGNVAVPHRKASDKPEDAEPMMTPDEIAEVALLMACLPPHVEMLEATVIPHRQMYVGRG